MSISTQDDQTHTFFSDCCCFWHPKQWYCIPVHLSLKKKKKKKVQIWLVVCFCLFCTITSKSTLEYKTNMMWIQNDAIDIIYGFWKLTIKNKQTHHFYSLECFYKKIVHGFRVVLSYLCGTCCTSFNHCDILWDAKKKSFGEENTFWQMKWEIIDKLWKKTQVCSIAMNIVSIQYGYLPRRSLHWYYWHNAFQWLLNC